MVEKADQLQPFDEMLQCLGGGGAAVCRTKLADWMIQRAQIVGATQTVRNVESYIQHDSFDAYQIMLLSTPNIEEEADLAENIRLVPIQKIPSERLLKNIGMDQLYTILPAPRPSGALIRKFRHKKEHISQIGESHFQYKPEGFEVLDDARLCLTLARKQGCAVQAIGLTFVAADEVPILDGLSWQVPPDRNPMIQAPLIGIEARAAKALHEDFLKLDAKGQAHLRIPMRKLNHCAAERDPVEAAVDLRVALESLFLTDGGQGELNYRLAHRAAIVTGGDLDQRKDTNSKITKVYSWCSTALHTGQVHSKFDRRQFNSVRSLVRDVLCQMIKNGIGRPDWKAVELKGE